MCTVASQIEFAGHEPDFNGCRTEHVVARTDVSPISSTVHSSAWIAMLNG